MDINMLVLLPLAILATAFFIMTRKIKKKRKILREASWEVIHERREEYWILLFIPVGLMMVTIQTIVALYTNPTAPISMPSFIWVFYETFGVGYTSVLFILVSLFFLVMYYELEMGISRPRHKFWEFWM